MSSGIDTGPAIAVVRSFIDATGRKDKDAMKACMSRASLEGGQFNDQGPQVESYTLGEVSVEEGNVIVPATMKAVEVPAGQPDSMTLPFVVIPEDGGWKIDMGKTIEKLMGFSMEAMAEQMGEAMKGVAEAVGEGMKQAFEGIGDAMGAMQPNEEEERALAMQMAQAQAQAAEQPDSPEFAAAKEEFGRQVVPEIESINEALGKQISVTVEWATFNGDANAAGKLSRKGVDPVRAAICLLRNDQALMQVLPSQLNSIRFRFVHFPEDKSVAFERGELLVAVCPAQSGGSFAFGDIQHALREGLDLERGPAMARLINEVMPELNAGIKKTCDVKVDHQVDLASFMDLPDRSEAVRAAKSLEDNVLRNWIVTLASVHNKVALYDRLWGVRFMHVPLASQRAIYADGNTLVYRVNLTEPDGYYYHDDMERILPGVIAAMPVASDGPEQENMVPPPELSGQDVIGYYAENFAPRVMARISDAVGGLVDLQADWDAFAADTASAHSITIWGLHRVLGAVSHWCMDADRQAALQPALNAIRLKYVDDESKKSIVLAGGVLELSIYPAAGEAGAFYEHDIYRLFQTSLRLEVVQFVKASNSEAKSWEANLLEEFKVPIRFELDSAGFFSHPQLEQNGFAVHILREHGINALYYAVTGIARAEGDKRKPGLQKRADRFREMMQRRVRVLRLIHVATPGEKSVTVAEGPPGAIEYRLYTHQGYDGYLTIDDLKEQLPDLLEQLPDMPDWEDDVVKPEPEPQEQEDEEREFGRLGREAQQEEDNFTQAVNSISEAIPSYEQSLYTILGHATKLTMDFDSLERNFELISAMMSHGLSPLWQALSMLAFDQEIGPRLKPAVQHVVITRVSAEAGTSMTLRDGMLVFATPMANDVEPATVEEVTTILRQLVETSTPAPPPPPPSAAPKPAAGGEKKHAPKPAPKSKSKFQGGKGPPKKKPGA